MTKEFPDAYDIQRWTPQGLPQILGCTSIINTLHELSESGGRFPNLMICGEPGTGKTAAINAFRKTLNCPHRSGNPASACGTCDDCHKFDVRYDLTGFYAVGLERVAKFNAIPLHHYTINCGDANESLFRELFKDRRDFQGNMVVFLDECQRLVRRSLDEMLLLPLEQANISWVAATARPEELDPMFIRRFALRLKTTPPTATELATFLADRCREWKIKVDDTKTLVTLAQSSQCRPSECFCVLSTATITPNRLLTIKMVEDHPFLPTSS